MSRSAVVCLIALLAAPALLAETTANAVANGDFETLQDDGRTIAHWPALKAENYPVEEGNRFCRVLADPAKTVVVYREVPLPKDMKAAELSFRARANDIQRGKANWHNGSVVLHLLDADRKKLAPPPTTAFRGSTDGWVEKSVSFLIPEGAKTLVIMPAMFMAKGGSLDVDDFVLTATDPAPIIAAREAAERKRQKEIARRAALVKPQVPVTPKEKWPPELCVKGNRIVDGNGKEVWLQGVAIASLEWSASGDNILKSVETAIRDWHANCIRLGIREDFWAGKGPYQKDGGAGYRQLVDDVVNYCAARGVYVVLDLHRFRAPTEAHAAFWTQVAGKYKNHPAVLFELFNEPHDITWEVWRNGGITGNKVITSEVVAENTMKLKDFKSVGMQGLVDAVRRTGARNIAIAGGVDWSYDISGVLKGFALDDHGGNGIVYSTHVYPWKSDWKNKFLVVAEKHPLFIGETGCTEKPMPFIDPKKHENPHTWAPDMIGLIQKHRLNWTAWCFHPKSSPCLLSDWEYTPTPYWGAYVKKALSGEQFEMKKMR